MAAEALFAVRSQPVTSNLNAAAMTAGDLFCNHQEECTLPLLLEPLPNLVRGLLAGGVVPDACRYGVSWIRRRDAHAAEATIALFI